MAEAFLTVAGRGRATFEDRGSEFIGQVTPVASIDEAEAFIDSVRETYDDATHNVPAYRVREDGFLREYATDDGEPSGSAGDPIATVLAGQELENVVAVVTRYYGGTNLGIGGLVEAYSTVTAAAIEDAGTETRRPRDRVLLETDYADSGTVRGILEGAELTFEADYDETVRFRVAIPSADRETLLDELRSATSDRIDIEDI